MLAWILAAFTHAVFESELCVGGGFDGDAVSGMDATTGSQNLCTI